VDLEQVEQLLSNFCRQLESRYGERDGAGANGLDWGRAG
jgi:hypothetical protein